MTPVVLGRPRPRLGVVSSVTGKTVAQKSFPLSELVCYTKCMNEKEREEADFRAWLRTLDRLPAEVPGKESWNNRVLMDTFEYLNSPMPKENER